MVSVFCDTCHLPALSKKNESFACCYGCELVKNLLGPGKVLFLTRVILSIFLYAILLLLKGYPEFFPKFSHQQILWVLFVLTTGILFLLGLPLFSYTLASLRRGRWVASEALIIFAILIDYAHSFHLTLFGWPTVADSYPQGYFPFYLVGLFLLVTHLVAAVEGYCRNLAHRDLSELVALRPTRARCIVKGQEIEVEVSKLKTGDVVKVLPGEVIPVSGIVLSGTTSVDESVFTGEKSILLKEKGERVTGASINRDGAIQVQVTEPVDSTFLESFIRLSHRAVASLPKIQGYFEKSFPLLILFTCLIALFCYFYYGFGDAPRGLLTALSVLVFMGLFTLVRVAPMVVAIAVGRSARNGVLLKDSEIFSRVSAMDHLFFDKTGTLTQARFIYSQFYLEKGVNQGTALSTLFSLESHSDHPLSKGVATHPWYVEVSRSPVKEFKSHAGLGICGIVCESGRPERFAAVGNVRFLKRFQMQVSRFMRDKIDELESMGETVILCGWEGQVRCLISFSDALRLDVKPLFSRLTKLHIQPIMITSDHDEMIAHLTYAHGLKQIYTRCLPEEKAKKIKNSQDKNHVVGMVSNSLAGEEEAFKQANVSFVVGTGTQIPDERVGVLVLGDNLLRVVDFIAYARRAYRTIKFSFILGSLYGIGGIILAGLGWLTPISSLIAMTASSLLLTVFPLTLRRVRFGG